MGVTELVYEKTSIYFSEQLSFHRLTYKVPKVRALVRALITQEIMHRKDA